MYGLCQFNACGGMHQFDDHLHQRLDLRRQRLYSDQLYRRMQRDHDDMEYQLFRFCCGGHGWRYADGYQYGWRLYWFRNRDL